MQGGPHNHTIGGLAVSLKHAVSPEFKSYQNKVLCFPLHDQNLVQAMPLKLYLCNYTVYRWSLIVELLLAD